MSQSFETFVPTLKHQKLLATAEAIALENDKAEDAKTLKQATEAAVAYFEQHRYWCINEGEMIFDRETKLLWQGNPNSQGYSLADARNNASKLRLGNLQGWQLPTIDQIKQIVENNFPLFLICHLQTGLNLYSSDVLA